MAPIFNAERRLSKKIDENLIKSLQQIADSEKRIDKLFLNIVEGFRKIAIRVKNENARYVISDLMSYSYHLEGLKKLTHNREVQSKIDALVKRVRDFAQQYYKDSTNFGGSFNNTTEKLNQFIVGIGNAINQTILKDLKTEEIKLRNVEDTLKGII